MSSPGDIVLLPDAGPLITLAYADALDLLFRPGWSVELVDMVLQKVIRNATPTSENLALWPAAHKLPVLPTRMPHDGQHAGTPHKPAATSMSAGRPQAFSATNCRRRPIPIPPCSAGRSTPSGTATP